jgi:VIT1/CCC1 family predicted Fe2+/Mn2+ transporter
MRKSHAVQEIHRTQHIGWMRAAVLGANDGIVSTASLIVGVASANSSHQNILIAGVAGLAAGAMSMACGEFVSVSSQADTERADLAIEKKELDSDIEFERNELAQIYVGRGVKPELAHQVAEQLMAHDAIGSHARDELGIIPGQIARPIQAAAVSAASFSVGASFPLAMAMFSPSHNLTPLVSVTSLFFLMLLGAVAAKVGGAKIWLGALRSGFWGAFAMAVTAGAGAFFGTVL